MNIYNTNHFTQININKIKSFSHAQSAINHNVDSEFRQTLDHVDKRRTHLNEVVIENVSDDDVASNNISKEIKSRLKTKNKKGHLIYEDETAVRSNAVISLEIEAGYAGNLAWYKMDKDNNPVEIDASEEITPKKIRSIEKGGEGYFLLPENRTEFDTWVARTNTFVQNCFGADNILSSVIHFDESKPHLHILVVPIKEDENHIKKLDCFNLMRNTPYGNIGSYARLQDVYAKEFTDLGYKRGNENSIYKHYSDREERREIASRVLEKTLPEDKELAKEAYKTAVCKISELEDELSRIKKNATDINKYKEQNKKLNEQINKQKATIDKLIPIYEDSVAEKLALKNTDVSKEARDNYMNIKAELIKMGRENLGIDISDIYEY